MVQTKENKKQESAKAEELAPAVELGALARQFLTPARRKAVERGVELARSGEAVLRYK